ncbi:MAG TPA: GTP cyclohydrolase FolE2 [Burkholderiales bacterium]
MNAPERLFLTDVQSRPDDRNVAIDQVGVRGLRLPVQVLARDGVQSTVAQCEATVALPPQAKGTHMSRFVEILEASDTPLSARSLPHLLERMLERLGARAGRLDFAFPFFIRKLAPVTGVPSLLDYSARMAVASSDAGAVVTLAITAPVTSLCPCSKEISAYGAHNQRSHVTLDVELRPRAKLTLETLAAIGESAASCEVYGLLKRPDEKFVTERAYDNPKFVEDLVRDLALALDARAAVRRYRVEVENFESIHNHSAYARIERVKA